jgi:hypothetical protein
MRGHAGSLCVDDRGHNVTEKHRLIAALIILALLCLGNTAAAQQAQQRTITFSNSSPPVTIRLDPNEPVSYFDNGNVSLVCLPGHPDGCPRLGQSGGGTPPPNNQCGTGVGFSQQLTVTFPTFPAPPGPFPPGAQIGLRATTTGGVICRPTATRNGSAVTITGWTEPATPTLQGVVTRTITLPNTPQATYILRLTCYGNTGSAWTDRELRTQ